MLSLQKLLKLDSTKYGAGVEMTQKQLIINYDKKIPNSQYYNIFLSSSILEANNQYFEEGLIFLKIKNLMRQFKFEQDIVFNPKSEMSYLYLSKIFKNLKNKNLEEQNLNTVILLNPKNEEAIYNLAKLKLEASDYKKSKELNDRLKRLCNKIL